MFEQHPEWFALADGERNYRKPCYAHPEVIRRGIDYALDYFEQDPDEQMVSLSPPDGGHYCRCDLTLAQAKVSETFEHPPHGTLFGRRADGVEVAVTSEEVFHFANEVARAVAEKYPGKRVGMLAYTAYAHPPSFDLEPNVHVAITNGYRFTPMSFEEQVELFGRKSQSLSVYEYFDVVQWAWERPGRNRASQLERVQANLRASHAAGVRGVSGEMGNNFAPYGVGYYAIARLLWDVSSDVREVEDELYGHAFGPAAEAVKRVYHRWESERWDWAMDTPTAMIAATYQDLDEAARLTEGQPVYRDRVNRLRMYAHFLNLYMPLHVGRAENDVKAWAQRYGEDEARRRLLALVEWNSRMMDTHMVHAFPLSRFLIKRGEVMGLDTSDWRRAGDIPTADEIDELFSRALPALLAQKAAKLEVQGDAADYTLVRLPDGELTTQDHMGANLRLGQIVADRGGNAVYVFELPVLPAGRAVHSATLNARVTVAYGSAPDAGSFAADLWGIGFQASADPILSYLEGSTDDRPTSVPIQQGWFVSGSVPTGAWLRTDVAGSEALGAYLQSFYGRHPNYRGGWYVFLRLNPDSDPRRDAAGPPQTGFAMKSAASDDRPRLTFTLTDAE